VCAWGREHTCVRVGQCVCAQDCVCVYIYIYICACVCIWMCMHMHVCVTWCRQKFEEEACAVSGVRWLICELTMKRTEKIPIGTVAKISAFTCQTHMTHTQTHTWMAYCERNSTSHTIQSQTWVNTHVRHARASNPQSHKSVAIYIHTYIHTYSIYIYNTNIYIHIYNHNSSAICTHTSLFTVRSQIASLCDDVH